MLYFHPEGRGMKGYDTMEKRNIYVDNSATTPVKPEVLDAMMPYFKEAYGNPSSIYKAGRDAGAAVENARSEIAELLGCKPREIFFTSCGSESDNWAIKGAAFANQKKGKHIITSAIEHHAVLHTCQYLEKQGFRVTYVGVDADGIIKLDELEKAICDDTILISVMVANNEIGTIQPIEEIGKIAKEHKILFHTDAVQAVGQLEINLSKLPVDMLSISGHKFGAPKGIGLLYVRSGVRIDNFVHGGGQERGKRAGTENTAYIAGIATALKLAVENIPEHVKKMTELRDLYISEVEKRISYIRLNGHRTNRLCTNANFSFSFIEGESLLLMLDMNGIAASSGSACTSGSLDPSHVLLAIGLPHETAHGSLRVTFGDDCTKDDVMYIVDVLEKVVSRLREMSPLYEKFLKEGK